MGSKITRTISTKVVLEGEGEYRKNLKGITADSKLLDAQMKELEARYSNCAKDAEYYAEKQRLLDAKIENVKNSIVQQNNALKNAEEYYDKATKAISSYADEIAETEENIERLNKVPKNEDVTAEIEKQKNKLEELKQAQRGAIAAQKTASERMTYWKTETAKATATMHDFKNAADKTKKEFENLGSSIDQADENIKDLGDSTSKLEELLFNLGITKGVKEIAAQLWEAAQAANVLEKAVAESKTLLDNNAENASYIASLDDDVKQFAKDMNVLTTEVTPALYNALSAGQDVDNVFDFLRTAQQSAVAGVTDVNTSTNLLTSIINAYGKEVMTADKASDVLFTTVKKGKTTFSELASSIYNVIPASSSLNISLEDVGAGMATITASGTPTTSAATQLRQVFNELSTAGTKVDTAFQEISGKTFKDFISEGGNVNEALSLLLKYCETAGTEFSDLWSSVEARSAALILTKNSNVFVSNLKAMQSAAGATAEAYKVMADTGDYSQKKLAVSAEAVKLAVGEALAPALNNAYENGADLLDGLTNVAEECPDLVRAVASLTTGLLAAAGAFTVTKVAAKALDITLSTTKIGAAAAVIGTLVTAVTAYMAFSDNAADKNEQLAESFDSISESAKATNDALKTRKAESEAEITMLDGLIQRYDELNSKEELNAGEKGALISVVRELESVYGDLGFVLDETTGKYNVLTKEIKAAREAMLNSIEDDYEREKAKNNYALSQEVLAATGFESEFELVGHLTNAKLSLESWKEKLPDVYTFADVGAGIGVKPYWRFLNSDETKAVQQTEYWQEQVDMLEKALKEYRKYYDVYSEWKNKLSEDTEAPAQDAASDIESASNIAEKALKTFQDTVAELPKTGEEWANSIKTVRSEISLLTSAIDEQNENSELSIDTALSLISANSEYAKALNVENGIIKLNKQYTEELTKARILEEKTAQEAAVKKAEAALQAVHAEISAQQMLAYSNAQSAKAMGDDELFNKYMSAYYSLGEQIGATADAYFEIKNNAEITIPILDELYESVGKSSDSFSSSSSAAEKAVDTISEFGEAVVEALENKYEELREGEEEMIDDSISRWKKWKEEQVSAIETQISALDELRETEEKENKSAELYRNYERIKYEARFASDEYNRAELEKAAASALQEYNDYQQDLADESVKKSLMAQKEQVEAKADKELSLLEEQKDSISNYYDTLISKDSLESEALKLINGDNTELLNLLVKYNPDFFGTEASFNDKLAASITSDYVDMLVRKAVAAVDNALVPANASASPTINNTTALTNRSFNVESINIYTSPGTTEAQAKDIAEKVMIELNKALS